LINDPRLKFSQRPVHRTVRVGERPTPVREEHTPLSQESDAAQFLHDHMTITSNR